MALSDIVDIFSTLATPSNIFYWASLVAMVSGVLSWLWHRRPNRYHRYTLRQANKSLNKIRTLPAQQPEKIIAYLRKMHPHAVEELVLSAAELSGHPIKRNTRYTGDGGIDGQILINGSWHLVQTKRYRSAINPAHVAAFSSLCSKRNQPGLFIHTGRTGALSRQYKGDAVTFVSGDKLVGLVLGRGF